MAISITSSVNLNDTTNVASGLAVTVTGREFPTENYTYELSVGGTVIATSTNKLNSFTITGITATEIYDNAYLHNLSGVVSLTGHDALDTDTYTKTGTLTINARLSSLVVTSPKDTSVLNMDLANPVNVITSWTRPHTAFHGRIKMYVNGTLAVNRGWFDTGANFDVVTEGYDSAIITAMGGVSPADLRYDLITEFQTGASTYTALSGVSDTETYADAITRTFITKSTVVLSNFTINSDLITNDLAYTLTSDASTTNNITLYVNSVSIMQITGITASGVFNITSTELTAMLNATDQITTSSCTAYAIVETFVGATSFGTTQSANVIATIDATYVPIITAQSYAEKTTSPDVNTLIGKFVQGISTLEFLTSGNTTASGTRIKQIKVEFNPKPILTDYLYTDNITSLTNKSLITTALLNSGTSNAIITITDFRNRATTYTHLNIAVLAYITPTINTFNVIRCGSGGSLNAIGIYGKYTLNGSVSSLINGTEKNELYYRIGYKLTGGGAYTYYSAVDTNAISFNSTYVSANGDYNVANVYDVIIEVYDVLTSGAKITSTDTMPYGKVAMMWGDDYVSFGKTATGTYNVETGAKGIGTEGQFVSTVATGTAPLVVASGTMVSNLNVQKLNGAEYSTTTFTPRLYGLTTAGTGTYTTRLGYYTRIGNIVFFSLDLIWTNHTGAGNMRIDGLPVNANATYDVACAVFAQNITTVANNIVVGYVLKNSNQIVLGSYTITTGANNSIVMDTTGTFKISGHYYV